MTLEVLKAKIPEHSKDLRLNLGSVLEPVGPLSEDQRWGVAVASAIAANDRELYGAILAEAQGRASPAAIEDAQAAASLMGMNNVLYRFRHFVEKPAYRDRPARLRMNRIVKPASSKADFELMCLAVSAINACESCVRAHEKGVLEAGLTEDHVHDAIRIAATVCGVAAALRLPI